MCVYSHNSFVCSEQSLCMLLSRSKFVDFKICRSVYRFCFTSLCFNLIVHQFIEMGTPLSMKIVGAHQICLKMELKRIIQRNQSWLLSVVLLLCHIMCMYHHITQFAINAPQRKYNAFHMSPKYQQQQNKTITFAMYTHSDRLTHLTQLVYSIMARNV